MDKLYVDCNILIDWLTEREPFGFYATRLIMAIEQQDCLAYVSPLTLANTFYIIRKSHHKTIAYGFLKDAQSLFQVLDLTQAHVKMALGQPFKDFEDDLHQAVAQDNQLTHLITRNKSDFRTTNGLIIQTAEEYLES